MRSMRINQATTAIDAYHAHHGKSADQRNRILNFVASRGGDWSIGEIASELMIEKSTVSARVNELLNQTGELEAKPKRKDRISDVVIRPVGLPGIGQRNLF